MSRSARPMTLQERVLQIDHVQARRLSKLSGTALEIATEGIIRHIRACARNDSYPDASAVREIIDDAIMGRRVWAESDAINSDPDPRLSGSRGYRYARQGVVDPLDKLIYRKSPEIELEDVNELKDLSLD